MIAIKFILIFLIGAFIGYLIELFYRNVIHSEHFNPGFLKGPYLPIYGFGVVILYLISLINMNIYLRMAVFVITLTLLELVTGLIFVKYFNVKLWDYSENKMNYKGIICFRYSLYWAVLSLLFYYYIYPVLNNIIYFIMLSTTLFFAFGVIFGIFIIDVGISMNLIYNLKKITKKNRKYLEKKHKKIKEKILINFKEFKERTKLFKKI